MNAKQAARKAAKLAEQQQKLSRNEFLLSRGEFYKAIKNNPDVNLVTEEEADRIYELLRLDSRTEDEWAEIKEILNERALLVSSPKTPVDGIQVYNHILTQDNCLLVFTNPMDCQEYVRYFTLKYLPVSTEFELGSMPFHRIVETAEQYKLDVVIDMKIDPGETYMYYNRAEKQIKAVRITVQWE